MGTASMTTWPVGPIGASEAGTRQPDCCTDHRDDDERDERRGSESSKPRWSDDESFVDAGSRRAARGHRNRG